MTEHLTTNADNAATAPESRAIVDAFRFLEDITEQAQALRKTLEAQVKSSGHTKQLSIKIDKFKEDYEFSKEDGWLVSSHIDTFEVHKAKGKTAIIYAAFQVSIAPRRQSAAAAFFPHVAVLLAGDVVAQGFERWKCEEFQLDDDFLGDAKEHDGEIWVKTGNRRWHGNDGTSVAFVVPLVDLRDERDTERLVISPFFSEARRLLRA